MMQDLIRHIYHRAIFLIDCCISRFSHQQPVKNSVAVIRVDAIGDFILWLPAAQSLRQAFPNARITLIANSAWADLAKELPYWDEVIAINTKQFAFANLLYRWKMICLIASKGFEVAVQPTFSRIISTGDSLVRATDAPKRIGIGGDTSNLSPKEATCANTWYTKLFPIGNQVFQELEKNRMAMEAMFGIQAEKILPSLTLDENSSYALTSSFDRYIVLVPGASWEGRRWRPANFAELAKYIANDLGLQVVICGSDEEFELGEVIRKFTPNTVNIAGKTTLIEMASVLKNALLVIGNESSAVHIANAVKTPSICILGGGHFGRFLPYPEDYSGLQPMLQFQKMDCYQCNWRCSQTKDFSNGAPCISGVTLETIKLAVKDVLSNNLKVTSS